MQYFIDKRRRDRQYKRRGKIVILLCLVALVMLAVFADTTNHHDEALATTFVPSTNR